MTETADLVVLGGGNGGYACALRAAQLGLSVTMVEQDKVGGTCLHRGCIPTKALLHAAELMEEIRSAGNFGVVVGSPGVDAAKVSSYKDSVVTKLYKGLQGVLKARKVNMVNGHGRLAGPDAVDVDGTRITAPALVLASGSRARSLPFAEIDGKAFISSDEALTLAEVPSSVIVIGAGAVGLEFASVWRSFGADVTVVEALPRLAPGEDEEVSKEVERQFRKRGIASHVGARVVRASAGNAGATIELETPAGQSVTLEAERCLIAIGRAPVSENLGYEDVGVPIERGFVVVDEWCRTGVDGVWAVGDLIAQPSLDLPFAHFQLAHVAFGEGIHVAEQVAGLEDAVPVDYVGVPRCTYSHPEIASVGLTEQQAKDAGYEVEIAKFPWSASGKATILGEPGGFVKVVAEKAGRVLGVHMVGARVTELIAEAQLITNWEAYPSEVAALIHPHPTQTEALGEAMLHLAGKQLHGA